MLLNGLGGGCLESLSRCSFDTLGALDTVNTVDTLGNLGTLGILCRRASNLVGSCYLQQGYCPEDGHYGGVS